MVGTGAASRVRDDDIRRLSTRRRMLRRPKLRERTTTRCEDEDAGAIKAVRVSAAVMDDADVARRGRGRRAVGEEARRGEDDDGFTLRRRRRRRRRDVEDVRTRVGKFLAKLDATKIDSASIKEQLERARARTSAVLKDIKVPKVEDLKNLIEDIREEQTLAQYHPDRKRLSSVADFFSYTEEEGTLCLECVVASCRRERCVGRATREPSRDESSDPRVRVCNCRRSKVF